MKQLLTAIVLLWAAAACTSEPETGEFSKEQVVQEVTAMLKTYHHAMEVGGLAAEFDYLDQSADFFWVPPGYESALDYDSVATILRANDKSLSKIVLRWDSLKVTALRADLAQYYGTILSSMTDTAQVTTRAKLVETGLIIKRADGWKLLNGQSAFFSIP